MAGSRRHAAATPSRAVESVTRTFAARMAGETPVTAAPGGRRPWKRARIAAPTARALAFVASAAEPTGGAPSAPCRNVTIRSRGVAAGRAPRGRRAKSAVRDGRRRSDAMLGGVGIPRTWSPRACAAGTDARDGAGNTVVVVITPLMAPSLGIHPVGAVSLLQAASANARRAIRGSDPGCLSAVPIDLTGKVTGRPSCRWDGATYGQSAPESGSPQRRPPNTITSFCPAAALASASAPATPPVGENRSFLLPWA